MECDLLLSLMIMARIILERFFKTPSFMLLALLNQGINPTDSSQKLANTYSICGFLEERPDSK